MALTKNRSTAIETIHQHNKYKNTDSRISEADARNKPKKCIMKPVTYSGKIACKKDIWIYCINVFTFVPTNKEDERKHNQRHND